jgi:HSP20 family protein
MSPPPSRYGWRLSDVEREINDAFAALVEGPWGRAGPGPTRWPATDLYETQEAYLLLADLPGVAPEDVELKVEERELALCGARWRTGFMRQGRQVIVERSCGRFCRRFSLPEPVDPEHVQHGYENGIYWARLPKRHAGETGKQRQ